MFHIMLLGKILHYWSHLSALHYWW